MTEPTTPLAPDTDDFDWSARNPDVIAAWQPSLAVYVNQYRQIVIRAERTAFEDEDAFICISTENAPKLIARLNKILEELTHAA